MLVVLLLLSVAWLGSGFRKVYIDLGANDGESVNSFITGPKDSGDAYGGGVHNQIALRTVGNKVMGIENDWEVYVFEANPHHTPRLVAQKEKMLQTNQVKAYHLFASTAISVKDGTISFILDNPGKVGDAGSTTMSESHSASIGNTLTVNCTDIVTLFKVIGRFKLDDYVIVKMDVEGAEYQIVRRIYNQNLLQYIDKISVEWHHTAFFVFGHPGNAPKNESLLPTYQKRLDIHKKYEKMYNDLMGLLSKNESAKFGNWGR